MASKKITASSRGSGTSNYTAYTSILHLGGGYRTRIAFDMSVIPADAKITGLKLYMTHSSSVYAAAQTVTFKTSASASWSYTSTGSMTKTSVNVSGNKYSWDIKSIGDEMLALGANCNLHLSTADGTDRPYDGTLSNVYLEVEYEESAETVTVYEHDGESFAPMNLYEYDGSEWRKANFHEKGAE